MLGQDEMRAWYGPDHVRMAVERGAVGTLLISDDLFRYVFHMSGEYTLLTESN
jgi:stalled ribosome rescue protein Dom34